MKKTLTYLFDPLCGWCYGASARLAEVANATGIAIRLLPTGLFSGDGARPMDDTFADYAWSNDQRIERLTGQHFSERYHSQILANRTQRFDSGPATLALTAVALTEPARELDALRAIQHARYVAGRDVTNLVVLADVLKDIHLVEASARARQPDHALLLANQVRMNDARQLMHTFDMHGVPAFLLDEAGEQRMLNANMIFSGTQDFIEALMSDHAS